MLKQNILKIHISYYRVEGKYMMELFLWYCWTSEQLARCTHLKTWCIIVLPKKINENFSLLFKFWLKYYRQNQNFETNKALWAIVLWPIVLYLCIVNHLESLNQTVVLSKHKEINMATHKKHQMQRRTTNGYVKNPWYSLKTS